MRCWGCCRRTVFIGTSTQSNITNESDMKKGYDTKLEMFTRLAGLQPSNPLGVVKA